MMCAALNDNQRKPLSILLRNFASDLIKNWKAFI